MVWEPSTRPCDLRSHALMLKAVTAAAQEEIRTALGQMRKKVRQEEEVTRQPYGIESPWQR